MRPYSTYLGLVRQYRTVTTHREAGSLEKNKQGTLTTNCWGKWWEIERSLSVAVQLASYIHLCILHDALYRLRAIPLVSQIICCPQGLQACIAFSSQNVTWNSQIWHLRRWDTKLHHVIFHWQRLHHSLREVWSSHAVQRSGAPAAPSICWVGREAQLFETTLLKPAV